MTEIDKILYSLGYFDADDPKKEEIQDYVDEAVEFMKGAGVPDAKLSSPTALSVKKIWANYRDKGNDNEIIKKEGMVVALISQLRRTPAPAPSEITPAQAETPETETTEGA